MGGGGGIIGGLFLHCDMTAPFASSVNARGRSYIESRSRPGVIFPRRLSSGVARPETGLTEYSSKSSSISKPSCGGYPWGPLL